MRQFKLNWHDFSRASENNVTLAEACRIGLSDQDLDWLADLKPGQSFRDSDGDQWIRIA